MVDTASRSVAPGPTVQHAEALILEESPAAGSRLKRMVDLTGALGLILVLAPILLAVALAVKVGDPGPALYRQTRIGLRGREFTMTKFRSMRIDADQMLAELREYNEADEILFKVRRDPRITGVGRVLRRYSLDELPQLFNVVRGDMSLVGPRPALPTEVALYPPAAMRRLAVRPGVTGAWQVSGRSDLPFSEAMRLDLEYVDTWSVVRDLQLLGRTVIAVLTGRGAY